MQLSQRARLAILTLYVIALTVVCHEPGEGTLCIGDRGHSAVFAFTKSARLLKLAGTAYGLNANAKGAFAGLMANDGQRDDIECKYGKSRPLRKLHEYL